MLFGRIGGRDLLGPLPKEIMIYLAIPYTYDTAKSFEIANKVSAKLMSEGHVVFSPISHSHSIADHLHPNLRTDQEFWMRQDIPMLEKCDEVYLVYTGDYNLIQNSKGVQQELAKARELKLPVTLYHYSE